MLTRTFDAQREVKYPYNFEVLYRPIYNGKCACLTCGADHHIRYSQLGPRALRTSVWRDCFTIKGGYLSVNLREQRAIYFDPQRCLLRHNAGLGTGLT